MPQAEESRIAQAQHLSAEAGIGANHCAHFLEVHGSIAQQCSVIEDAGGQRGQALTQNTKNALLALFRFFLCKPLNQASAANLPNGRRK